MAVAGQKYFATQKKAAEALKAAEAKTREDAHRLVEAQLDRRDVLATAIGMTDEQRIAALEASLTDVLGMAAAHAERIARTRGQQKTAYQARRSIERAQILLDAKPLREIDIGSHVMCEGNGSEIGEVVDIDHANGTAVVAFDSDGRSLLRMVVDLTPA